MQKLKTKRPDGSSWRWCSRVKTGRLSSTSSIMAPLPHRVKRTPQQALDAIGTTIKAEDHYWHFWDKILSDVCQLPNKGIHALNTRVTTLISQCKFPHPKTQEMLKIMVLQHAVQYREYHEARDWVQLQDQSQLKALLSHCKLLESCCEEFQKAKEKGQADLTPLTTATPTASSIHTDTLSTLPRCDKCGYSHPPKSALPKGRSATTVAAITIILPCTDPKDLSDHHATSEAQSTQADHPSLPGQGTPKMTSTDQADPPGDITDAPQAITLPAVLSLNDLPASPLDVATDGASPSNMTRAALNSSQCHPSTALRPLHTPKTAPCWWNKHQMAKSHSTPAWCYLPRMGPNAWWWRLSLVFRWTQYPWAGIRSSSP